jgi:RNA polymerase sigma-70 factor (ECF subfamily)
VDSVVDRCRAGDASAWEEVVRAHGRRIYNLCYRFTGRPADAQDLTQEIFVKAYRNLGSYDPARAALGTWITTIARHAVVDFFRRTKSHRRTESLDDMLSDDEDAGGRGLQVRAEGPQPDASLAVRDTQRVVQTAIQRLRPELREVVILRDLQDLDYSEIAALLQIPEGTVKSRISRARAELARILIRIYPQVPSK